MTDIFHDGNRQLQDRFDTRRMADRVGELTHDFIAPHDKAFIERMDMFFIATVDEHGHANCSYKGGEPGFVRVVDEQTIAFPNFDGNGMYLSMGNVLKTSQVGLLFIDFENQHRMRVNGEATIHYDDPLHGGVPGGAVHRPREGARDVPELPALHPQDAARRAVAVRAEGRVQDTGAVRGRRASGWRARFLSTISPHEADREVLRPLDGSPQTCRHSASHRSRASMVQLRAAR